MQMTVDESRSGESCHGSRMHLASLMSLNATSLLKSMKEDLDPRPVPHSRFDHFPLQALFSQSKACVQKNVKPASQTLDEGFYSVLASG